MIKFFFKVVCISRIYNPHCSIKEDWISIIEIELQIAGPLGKDVTIISNGETVLRDI